MAHNTRMRANLSAWAAGSVVTPTEFDTIDQLLFEAINGDKGGTWNPQTPIEIGGAGLRVTGPLHISGDFASATLAQNFISISDNFTNPVFDVAYSGTRYVAVGGPTSKPNNDDSYITTSLDGLTWTDASEISATTRGVLNCVAADPDTGIVITGGAPSSGDNDNGWKSTDRGATWSELQITGATNNKTIVGLTYFAPAGIWVAGTNDGDIWTSTDTVTWTLRASNLTGTGADLALFAYRRNPARLVVCRNDTSTTSVAFSSAGTSWSTSGVSLTSIKANALTYSEYWGKWIMVGDSGKVRVSTTGTNWTNADFVNSANLLGVAALGPLLVILVGSNNLQTIWSLDGGTTWYQGATGPVGTGPKLKVLGNRLGLFDQTKLRLSLMLALAGSAPVYT